jgi:hypothetical protein
MFNTSSCHVTRRVVTNVFPEVEFHFEMFSGRRFRLNHETIAISGANGKREAIMIPESAIVKVISGPTSERDRMVDVLWDGQVVVMFAVDLIARGEEIVTHAPRR